MTLAAILYPRIGISFTHIYHTSPERAHQLVDALKAAPPHPAENG